MNFLESILESSNLDNATYISLLPGPALFHAFFQVRICAYFDDLQMTDGEWSQVWPVNL